MNHSDQKSEKLVEIVRQLVDELHPHRKDPLKISLDSHLERDLGIDSLGMVELLSRIDEQLGISLPEQVITSTETPRDLLRALMAEGRESKVETSARVIDVPSVEAEALPLEARTLLDLLEWHERLTPDRQHIFLYLEGGGEEIITYKDLLHGAKAVAAGLVNSGLQARETVAIMLPTGKDYFFSFFGILFAGGIPVPLYPPAKLSQIEDHLGRHAAILNNALAALLITIPEAKIVARLLQSQVMSLKRIVTVKELSAEKESCPPLRLKGEDTVFLQYTSGTTGTPKGVVLSHNNLLANIRAMGNSVQATSRDVFVSWLPLYHDMGLIGAWLGSLYYGMPLVLMSPLTFLVRPERWLQAIHRHGGTISGGPNFGYELCIRKIHDDQIKELDLSSWRMAFNGAEKVSPHTITKFIDRFSKCGFKDKAFAPVYGLAESSVGLAFPPLNRGAVIDKIQREIFVHKRRALPALENDPNALMIVASGRPLEGHEIRIVDSKGRELGEREEGRLQFKGPSATSGYLRNPEATERLFDGEWLEAGDLAYMTGGDVFITGRSKDIIIRAGRNIYPEELEEAVGNIPGARKGCVAAFGATDPKSGTERLVLLVETRERGKGELDRLHDKVNAITVDLLGLPPEEILLVPPQTVLKTSSGKIRRAACKELYEKGKTRIGQRAVWWQFARLAAAGIIPQIKRYKRETTSYLYASYAWVVFFSLAILTWTAVAIMPNVGWRRAFISLVARLAVKLSGIKLSVKGLDNLSKEPTILAANHSSYIDGIILAAALPPLFGYVAKRDIKGSFIPQLFLRRVKAQFVERFDAEKGLKDAGYLSASIQKGKALIFFPEGTFRRMPGLLPFHMGAFVTAAEAGVPVIPVAIHGTRSILRAKSWFPRRGDVTVTINEPIIPEGRDWAAAIKLRDAARSHILKHCGEPDSSS